MILAAARSTSDSFETSKHVFQVALDLFRQVHDGVVPGVAPNAFTYTYFIRACNSLLPAGDEREKLITKAYTLCQQRGLVSKEVWADAAILIPDYLKGCLEQEGLDSSLTGASAGGFLLPENWTRNLKQQHKQQAVHFG